MEDSPLNKAHQLHRHAEALLRQNKFDECIEAHQSAANYLHESLLLTENPYSRESIELQIGYHQKQIGSLKIKKLQHEDSQRYRESIRHKVNFVECDSVKGDSLQNAIYRTMETHDSLIGWLVRRNDSDSLKSYSTSDTDEKGSGVDLCDGLPKLTGRKHQVDDSTIIEEFQVLSEQLRRLVTILMAQLKERDDEIAVLRAEVSKLECEKDKAHSKSNNSLKVITDSSGGTSPYVFSPCSELSPEVHDTGELPTLAPLGSPNFDFSRLPTKNTTPINNGVTD